jgi:hypothetical protein
MGSLIGAMTFFNRTKGEQSYSFGLIQGVSCTDKFLLICFQPYKDRCVA